MNNIINHLIIWCRSKADVYQRTYNTNGGGFGIGRTLAYELDFKLSTLIDKPFESADALKNDVLDLMDIHYEPGILNPQNRTEQYIIDKVKREFREHLDEVLVNRDTLPLADLPYSRVIVGLEAEALQERFRTVWGYENNSYWFPLMGEKPKEVADKFFIMFDHFEPYMKQFEQIIGLPQNHLYSYGETICRPPHCFETVELIEYGGCETIYTDKDFSWAVYFSHEDTVAFAGAIVPAVKELLMGEKEHWDKFEWDWMME